MFIESSFDEREGEVACVDRKFGFQSIFDEFNDEVWNSADVVFVGMRDEKSVWRKRF